jgi:MFS transporter, OFA family, oxalate/formate antiporter
VPAVASPAVHPDGRTVGHPTAPLTHRRTGEPPLSLKWFPPSKTGLIAGLVVAGFGLASVYIAPLSEYLLTHFGVLPAMLFYSIFFVVVVCGLSTLLVNPPPGYVPPHQVCGEGP